MKYAIRDFQAPHVLVEYSTDDDQHTAMLNVRIDKKLDGTLPQGEELDAYILSYAPQLPPIDPYAGVDWTHIKAKVVKPTPVVGVDVPACVTSFLASKGISENTKYAYSVYDATGKADIATVFSAGKYLIKTDVAETTVLEWYEHNVGGNAWVSRDVASGDIVDRYVMVQNGVKKLPSQNSPAVTTYFGAEVDPLIAPQIADFQYANSVRSWSSKANGSLVVEYIKR